MIIIDKCPVCFSTQFERHFDVPYGSDGAISVARCMSCASLFKLTVPDPAMLGDYYQDEGYYSFKLSTPESPNHQSRMQRIRRKAQPAKILDVGCGNGAMVKEYLDVGWDAYGIDPFLRILPGPEHPLHSRLYRADLATTGSLPVSGFDVVTLWYVLEHTSDPEALLLGAARNMVAGGTLIVLVPWAESLACIRYGDRWAEITNPEHLVCFSRDGLGRLLAHCGFGQLRFRYAGRPFPLGRASAPVQAMNTQSPPNAETGAGANSVGLSSRILKAVTRPAVAGRTLRFMVNMLRMGDYIEVYATKVT